MSDLRFPKEWSMSHFFRPTNTVVNLDAMRKQATSRAVAGYVAVIHHHDADAHCTPDTAHEYFGFGPHDSCDRKGCDNCENGWKKHG